MYPPQNFQSQNQEGKNSSEMATVHIKTGLHENDDAIFVYFTVVNIEAAVAKVRRLGGSANDPIRL